MRFDLIAHSVFGQMGHLYHLEDARRERCAPGGRIQGGILSWTSAGKVLTTAVSIVVGVAVMSLHSAAGRGAIRPVVTPSPGRAADAR